MEKKIAILHIATGRYTVFWRDFYRSFEEFFLPDCPKTFFLFTDDDSLSVDDNVVKIHQENLGWPYITLLRFEIFLKVEEQLKQFDYIYFFNANMMAVVKIGEEVLPSSGQELALALHPYLGFQPRSRWTYDKNPYSRAYIPDHQGDYYVMGSFIGGTRGGFLRMCHVLCDNIRADLQQGIIALWHDESHLNHYILDKDPLILSSEYISVEGWPLPFKPKIVYLEKSQPRYGGHDYMRGLTDMPNHVLQAHPESLDKYIRSLYFKKTWKTLIKQFLARLLIGNDNLQVVSLSDEGLGIQMFQYAFACCLSEKGRKVIFDRCELFAHNLLEGGGVNLPLYQLSADIKMTRYSRLLRLCPWSVFRRFLQKLIKRITVFTCVQDPGISYAKILYSLPGNIWYRGHFLDERYFHHLSTELRRDFRLKNKMNAQNRALLAQIKLFSSVAVCLYNCDKTNPLVQSYYKHAVQYILKNTPAAHFFIFGGRDDILTLPQNSCTIVPCNGSKEHWDLELIKNCQYHIIGHSPLAWWGAWLAENPEKIVVVPKIFSSGYVQNCDMPDAWIRL